tara:strand:- start:1473 stop:2147 length:675 start_codon:yes stop_codon:yes gene_type:complete
MLLKIDKHFRFFIYFIIIIFLTSINNYNLYNKKIFNIDRVEVNGFSEKKNIIIKNEIKNILGKNIFLIKKNYFKKLFNRNDTKDLIIKKVYPNKLIISFIPSKPICIILLKDRKIILGDNGKKLNIEKIEKKLPKVFGSEDFDNILKVVNMLKLSKLDYDEIDEIVFFKSGRFDINLKDKTLIKFPIRYTKETVNYSSYLLNDKRFVNSKVIDLRLENKIIKYE